MTFLDVPNHNEAGLVAAGLTIALVEALLGQGVLTADGAANIVGAAEMALRKTPTAICRMAADWLKEQATRRQGRR